MHGLVATNVTRRQLDGSDPQLQLAQRYAEAKKRTSSAVSSARSSMDEHDSIYFEKQQQQQNKKKSESSPQKQRLSLLRAANTVFSLK